MLLNDKVVLVTGGAGLIGQEFVRVVLANGGKAIVGDINESASTDFITKLNNKNAEFIKLDINSKDSINECLGVIKKKHGKLDALVNNAYPRNNNFGRSFFEVDYKDFCENLNLNLGGYFLMSQQAALVFKQQGHGNIVNISSIYGIMPPRFEVYDGTDMTLPVEYAAIKSALLMLSQYMAKYFKGLNIRVNSISPGGVLRAQPPKFLDNYKKMSLSKGMLSEKDLAGSLLFLLSDQSTFMNGQNLVVDDGFSL